MTTIQIDNFLDWEVFATRPNWATQPRVKLDHEYDFFTDIGRAIARSSNDIAREVLTYEYLLESKEEIAGLRDFFDSQYGMVGTFWIPSWRSDIVVTTPFTAGDTDLFIEDIKYPEYFFTNAAAGRYVMFLFPDLTRIYNKIIGAPAGDHIVLDTTIGKAATAADLQYLLVSFLYLVRFDVDELRFDYHTNIISKATINFRTVYEEAVVSTTTSTSTTSTSSTVTTTTVTVVTTTTTV